MSPSRGQVESVPYAGLLLTLSCAHMQLGANHGPDASREDLGIAGQAFVGTRRACRICEEKDGLGVLRVIVRAEPLVLDHPVEGHE